MDRRTFFQRLTGVSIAFTPSLTLDEALKLFGPPKAILTTPSKLTKAQKRELLGAWHAAQSCP